MFSFSSDRAWFPCVCNSCRPFFCTIAEWKGVSTARLTKNHKITKARHMASPGRGRRCQHLRGSIRRLAACHRFSHFLSRCKHDLHPLESRGASSVLYTPMNVWVGILSENDMTIALETTGTVSNTTETMERYLAQKGMLLRYAVTDLTLLCVQLNLPGRATKEVLVHALLFELEFDI